MAFCRNCGKQVPDLAVVCVSCGCNPKAGSKFCQACGAETVWQLAYCAKCGMPLTTVPPPDARSRIAAGLLGVFLGGFGVHRFYLGYIGVGIAQIFVTLCTCGLGAIWGFIEGILILTSSMLTTDAAGRPLKD